MKVIKNNHLFQRKINITSSNSGNFFTAFSIVIKQTENGILSICKFCFYKGMTLSNNSFSETVFI
ncbi:MAG: hypothetical protein ucyna2_00696 [Candidatus Atelocyanobacterium thalassa isolate SIO64986]|uniref:Uncharacterized protein n=1 Tax=Candidatus Atelocyanobacterium thalassa isolate SIO64986 TaxID=1527444 RepID=A0A086CH36_9CHRO|nr:MAG: hypothetical protein ucyna2_00696 [Candidatus Atelocyanobacterium thalassa isolate SIO64986]